MDQTTPLSITFGSLGWLVFLAFAVGLVVRLLKADALNTALAKFGIKPIPKAWLPWLSLVFGFAGGALNAKVGGHTWNDSALVGAWGLVGAGGGAIALNEALGGLVRSVSPTVSNLLFGRNAGPTLKTVPLTPPPEGAPPDPTPPPSTRAPSPPPPPVVLGALLLVAALALPGCAAVAAAMPYVVQTIAVVAEGASVLAQVQAFARSYFAAQPDAKLEQEVNEAIADAARTLAIVGDLAKGAQNADQERVGAALKDFQHAYEKLQALIGSLKGVKVATPDKAAAMRLAPGERVLVMPAASSFSVRP